MKFKKGDKVACLSVTNIRGVGFTCIVGKLLTIKKHWSGLIYVLEGRRSFLLKSEQDLKGQRFELGANVWTLLPWNDKTKKKVTTLRDAAAVFDELAGPLVGRKTQALPPVKNR